MLRSAITLAATAAAVVVGLTAADAYAQPGRHGLGIRDNGNGGLTVPFYGSNGAFHGNVDINLNNNTWSYYGLDRGQNSGVIRQSPWATMFVPHGVDYPMAAMTPQLYQGIRGHQPAPVTYWRHGARHEGHFGRRHGR